MRGSATCRSPTSGADIGGIAVHIPARTRSAAYRASGACSPPQRADPGPPLQDVVYRFPAYEARDVCARSFEDVAKAAAAAARDVRRDDDLRQISKRVRVVHLVLEDVESGSG